MDRSVKENKTNGHAKDILEEVGLSRIDPPSQNPFDLFKEWHQEAQQAVAFPNALCLSTTTRNGEVSGRNVILRRLEDDGFVIITDRRSRKVRELGEVPAAAITFFWGYYRDSDGKLISRQVRAEGPMMELDPERYRDIYDREPLYCKLRSYICEQDSEVCWEQQLKEHDDLVQAVQQEGKPLTMLDHVVGFKMIPKMIEFYGAVGMTIGDRVLFNRSSEEKGWTWRRIAA